MKNARRETEMGTKVPVISFKSGRAVPLPPVEAGGPLEQCLRSRRSTRNFKDEAVSLAQVTQLLWAGQGVTGLGGLRAVPSAGAMYPLRTYLVAAHVEGLVAGVYQYNPDGHTLEQRSAGDKRQALSVAMMGQECITECTGAILFTAWFNRVAREFGEHAARLVHIEAGHAGQNICLQATALGLGVIGLGRYDPDALRTALSIPSKEEPVYLIAFGRK